MIRKTAIAILFLFITSFVLASTAFADGPYITFSFDKEDYHPGNMVTLTASLSSPIITNLTFEVREPDEDLLLILTNQTDENGITSISFRLGGEAEYGEYVIYVGGNTVQGLIENQTSFSVSPGYIPLVISPSDITASKINPANNENITLYAMVYNSGNTSITTTVTFYEGDPEIDEILIDSTEIIIQAKSSEVAKIDYTALDGNHTVYVVLEADEFPSTTTSRTFSFGPSVQPILELSTHGDSVIEFKSGEERTIALDVTCYLQTVQNVHLVVLDSQNLTINATISTPRTMTAGETFEFQLRIQATELPEGTDQLERNILIQVVGDDGVFSDAETLNILVKKGAEGQLDSIIIVIALVAVILIIILAIWHAKRRRDNQREKQRNKIEEDEDENT